MKEGRSYEGFLIETLLNGLHSEANDLTFVRVPDGN